MPNDKTKQYETVRYERLGTVGLLTLDRPQRLNAINRPMLRELHQVLDAVEADPEVRVLVVTGAGDTFCSGFDLKEQAEARPQGVDAWQTILQDDFDAIIRFWRLSKPTIAAVRGHAVASGCELALCCDITIAADNAVFGEPELKFGAGIVVMIMPWITGPKKTKELLFSGDDSIDAAEAHRLGLVNQVVPLGQELDTALALARRIGVVEPTLMRLTKLAVNRSYDIMGMRHALETALDLDLQIEAEGMKAKAAFMEVAREKGLKAAIDWRDRRFAEAERG